MQIATPGRDLHLSISEAWQGWTIENLNVVAISNVVNFFLPVNVKELGSLTFLYVLRIFDSNFFPPLNTGQSILPCYIYSLW